MSKHCSIFDLDPEVHIVYLSKIHEMLNSNKTVIGNVLFKELSLNHTIIRAEFDVG